MTLPSTLRRGAGQSQRGVAAIEFALTTVFLVPLVLGSVDIGMAVYQYNTLVKTARTGARYLAASLPGDIAARTNATNLMVYGALSGNATPVVPGLDTSKVFICDAVTCTGRTPNPNLWYKAPGGVVSRGGVNLVTVEISNVGFTSSTGLIPAFNYGTIKATVAQGM